MEHFSILTGAKRLLQSAKYEWSRLEQINLFFNINSRLLVFLTGALFFTFFAPVGGRSKAEPADRATDATGRGFFDWSRVRVC